ncbi:MAG: hypothetical protein GY752_10650 [bacterium]|nr:hypothetical protein [bacterium]MCP4798666.1 hypothetical protein [bacterium]
MRKFGWMTALVPALIIIIFCMLPVFSSWDTHMLGPFGGIDALLQAGILQWSGQNFLTPELWYQLPIFYPEHDVLGYMDSLLGQALSIQPILWLADISAAAQYNWAMLVSLILSAISVLLIWRNSGGDPIPGAIVTVVVIGSPYTLAQLGHLNQLPPPMVFFAIAAVIGALNSAASLRNRILWWGAAMLAVVSQAMWGWYGFVYAAMGAAIPVVWNLFSRREYKQFIRLNWVVLPMLLIAVPAVLWMAEPQLRVADRYSEFDRSDLEIRAGSADLKHLFERGVYRSNPADWVGKGLDGAQRYEDRERQVLNPGWLAIALAVYGIKHRRKLPAEMLQHGYGLLSLGFIGLIFAFGESTGLPFTDKRMLLPFGVLREFIDSLRAFRGAWRFSLLTVLAVAWWAGFGFSLLRNRYGVKAFGVPVLLVLISLPVTLPIIEIPSEVNLPSNSFASNQKLLTLPAPLNEYVEDQTEVLWLLRAITTENQVTGGATGWVPDSIIKLRVELSDCEAGLISPPEIFDRFIELGITGAEIAERTDDSIRVEFWRKALSSYGATEMPVVDGSRYSRWVFEN